jgi:phosphatidate cytidylyltransferase
VSGSLSNLQLRIISGAFFGAIVIAGVWLGGLPFRILCSVMAAGIFVEWRAITATRSPAMLVRACEITFIAALGALIAGTPELLIFGLLAGAVLAGYAAMAAGKSNIWLPAGIAYAGFPAACLAFLRGGDETGLVTALLLLATVWATDIFAYFVGRSLGGPKLAPSISPGKTWTGGVGGVAAAVAATLAVAAWFGPAGSPVFPIVIALVSVWSQIGDLFESWVKRRFGVKDSGTMIPGHGGMMDRVDGLVAAAVALYALNTVAQLI